MTTLRMVLLRGALYVAIAVLTPVAAVYGEAAQYQYWPDTSSVVSGALTGLLSGLVALRAFLDGSAERLANGGGK